MTDLVLRVDQLSKAYRITHAQGGRETARYKTLQEDLLALPRHLLSVVRGQNGSNRETIWAIKDISFDVKQGEVVGIIGRNGAGKSTLLKILSRITDPTEGRAEVYGRVDSLLEVGTGFHPELTGRENISLNGAILGMRRHEIARKFDEIVTFAGVEKFIDTPVKFYSSGMYVRLAFAVAAHLEPEILIVDEVLAVGDMEFQKKCLKKMGDVAQEGRTVLFVSHNMAAITSLCSRGILIEKGRVACLGTPKEVVDVYSAKTESLAAIASSEPGVWQCPPQDLERNLVIYKVEMLTPENNERKSSLAMHDAVTFRLHYRSKMHLPGSSLYLNFRTRHNVIIAGSATHYEQIALSIMPGEGYADCMFPEWLLTAGVFILEVGISDVSGGLQYHSEEYGLVSVMNSLQMQSHLYSTNSCFVYLPHTWSIQQKSQK